MAETHGPAVCKIELNMSKGENDKIANSQTKIDKTHLTEL